MKLVGLNRIIGLSERIQNRAKSEPAFQILTQTELFANIAKISKDKTIWYWKYKYNRHHGKLVLACMCALVICLCALWLRSVPNYFGLIIPAIIGAVVFSFSLQSKFETHLKKLSDYYPVMIEINSDWDCDFKLKNNKKKE